MLDLLVLGAGAAGIFGAIAAKSAHPKIQVIVLEKTAVLLAKVRISGGGRCNVTHACFDPKALVQNYPRGQKELLGPFHRFQPKDTIEWFESRGVRLKTEKDGRIFPITDSSETIIACLLSEAKRLGVEIRLRQKVERVERIEGGFQVGEDTCRHLLLATGSGKDGYTFAKHLGHTIQEPVPSLFTFNVPTSPLLGLSGIAVPDVQLTIGPFTQRGPLLLTHFGFSGPAALKLSAFAARYLYENKYLVPLEIDWLPDIDEAEIATATKPLLPKNLWRALGGHSLHKDIYQVEGKTTHKEEFVTCGGITLKEIDFRTMQSKLCPGLFFAGEILDIDGVTGGFNFQNAWTTGFIAGTSL